MTDQSDMTGFVTLPLGFALLPTAKDRYVFRTEDCQLCLSVCPGPPSSVTITRYGHAPAAAVHTWIVQCLIDLAEHRAA